VQYLPQAFGSQRRSRKTPSSIPRDEKGRIAVGGMMVPAVEVLMEAIAAQSKLNAIAAAFAGAAAILAAAQAFMPTCWG
jgi:hypothetical protein